MTTKTVDFNTNTTETAPGEMLPHAAGRKLWFPMFLMALMGFGAGIVLAFFRADAVNSGDVQAAAALGHFVPAFMFLGFAAVFAAIAFAVARILGVFRAGGGGMQERCRGADVDHAPNGACVHGPDGDGDDAHRRGSGAPLHRGCVHCRR